MYDFASSSIAQAIGWSLIHFLWQGSLIALITWLFLSLCGSKKSNLRYLISCCSLCLILACPIATTLTLIAQSPETDSPQMVMRSSSIDGWNGKSASPRVVHATSAVVSQNSVRTLDVPDEVQNDSSLTSLELPQGPQESSSSAFGFWVQTKRMMPDFEPAIPTLIWAWAIGVLFLSTRLVFAWVSVQQLRKTGKQSSNPIVIKALDCLRSKLNSNVIIPVHESLSVHSPMVIGWLKPVILLPASALTNLSVEQLSAILAHELAHVRRADYLVNLLQSMIEILLFYHPAVWWVSWQIRKERENCCDDLAVRTCGNRRQYAEALLELEQTRNTSLAMASSGGSLVQRIARVLGHDAQRSTSCGWLAALTSAMLVCLLAGFVLSESLIANELLPPEPQQNMDLQQDDEPAATEPEVLRVKVLSPDKTPLKGMSIKLGVWYQETATSEDFVTDDDGIVEIKLPKDINTFRLWAYGEGYTRLFANWESEEFGRASPLPAEFVFDMIPAVKIAGIVVDESGTPIPDVSVEVRRVTANDKPGQRTKFGSWFAEGPSSIITDDDGKWTLNNIPPGDDIELALRFSHPDFVGDENWGEIQASQSVGLKELREETARIVLRKGVKIRGTITNDQGEPVKDAMIVWGDDPYLTPGRQELMVEDDGTYEMPTQKDGELRVTVIAPQFAPQTKRVDVTTGMENVDFSLTSGKPLVIQFVDERGEAVPNVYVGIRKWRNTAALFNHQHPNVFNTRIPRRSDVNGVYEWDWAPDDAITYSFYASGYIEQGERTLSATSKEHTIVMKKKAMISGEVHDRSGNPIESFLVIPQFHVNDQFATAQRSSAVQGRNGKFEILLDGREGDYSLIIEAEGFETTMSPKFERDSRPNPFNIELKESTAKSMRVIDAIGKPVSNATLVLAPSNQVISFSNYNDQFAIQRSKHTTSNEKGSFLFPTAQTPRTIIAISEHGYGEVPDSAENPADSVTIREWSSLKGFATLEGEPWDVKCWYRPTRLHHGKYFHIQSSISSERTGKGKFVIPKIAPMTAAIDIFGADDPLGRRYTIPISPEPGKEIDIDFSKANTLTAEIKFSGINESAIDYRRSKFTLRRTEPSVEFPSELIEDFKSKGIDPMNFNQVSKAYASLDMFHSKICYTNCFDTYKGSLDENGKLTVDILRPGKYILSIQAFADSNSKYDGASMSQYEREVEIEDRPIAIGKIEVPLLADPEENSLVANFEFINLVDDSQLWLEDLQGEYLVLDFWCPYCDACGKETPRIQRLAGILARSGKTKMISLKSSGSGPVERVPNTVSDELPWINGQVKYADEEKVRQSLGVWTTQHLVLIDPEGRYVFGGNFAEMVKKLDELDLK